MRSAGGAWNWAGAVSLVLSMNLLPERRALLGVNHPPKNLPSIARRSGSWSQCAILKSWMFSMECLFAKRSSQAEGCRTFRQVLDCVGPPALLPNTLKAAEGCRSPRRWRDGYRSVRFEGPGHGRNESEVSRNCSSLWRVCLVAFACCLLAGCQKSKGTVLGKAPEGKTHSVLAVQAGDTPSKVTLSGVLVEKCPVAGCWFRLRDESGTLKVDTKAAGFVVVGIPLQTKMTVSGKVASEGEEIILEASGLRY